MEGCSLKRTQSVGKKNCLVHSNVLISNGHTLYWVINWLYEDDVSLGGNEHTKNIKNMP